MLLSREETLMPIAEQAKGWYWVDEGAGLVTVECWLSYGDIETPY